MRVRKPDHACVAPRGGAEPVPGQSRVRVLRTPEELAAARERAATQMQRIAAAMGPAARRLRSVGAVDTRSTPPGAPADKADR
ncbi:MAG: hypothetical protein M0013_14405 [Actinomycetota bacterium]|nr:hypothetical protein [Actinomycetota bacterium]